MTTRVLDRIQDHQESSRAWGIADAVPEPVQTSVFWRPGPQLDQGDTGHCGGFSSAGEAGASPFRVKGITNEYAHGFYYEAKDRGFDSWGREDGTSTLAMLKVGQVRGLWDNYRWAFSLEDTRRNLRVGPYLLGVPWFTGCFSPDSDGIIKPTGVEEGGHLVVVTGWTPNYVRKGPHTRIRNSWGSGYGKNGSVYISDEGLYKILIEGQGEAGVPVGRHLV